MKQDSQGHSVRLDNTGEVFACREDQNVLLAMETLGRRGIPVGCRGGGCGVCKLRVTAGRYEVRKMSRACVSREEEAAGVVLACKLYPRSDLVTTVVGKMVKGLPSGPGGDYRQAARPKQGRSASSSS